MRHPRISVATSLVLAILGLNVSPSSAFAESISVSADFHSRVTNTYQIPPDLFGVGLGGGLHIDTLSLMTEGGLTYTRFHATVQDTFKTSIPDWSSLDAELASIQAAGLHVILEMDYTPASLQPSKNPCPSGVDAYHAYPTSMPAFAKMAAAYVTHFDSKFPGVVSDYEIWNEPDGGGSCTPGNTEAQKLAKYLELFAAVASAIHNAATRDGAKVRTGGPTLGSPLANGSSWISALLSHSDTAPYVDFVAFHYYASGLKDVDDGLTWDGRHGTPSLYVMTQSSKSSGLSNIYKAVDAIVRKGSQPNPDKTPIYIDEYNSDWAFVKDCCRNSETYAPVWNAMVYVDLLNSIYSGAAAVPGKILYYAVSNDPFCIAGVYNSSMNCEYPGSGAPTPYPQYYAMKLFSSRSYLGLQDGGYMARSVDASGTALLATAFWTAAGDTIVIVNPGATSYSNVAVAANNSGIATAQGTVDIISNDNRAITTETTNLLPTATGYVASIYIPAYSVVALTLTKSK